MNATHRILILDDDADYARAMSLYLEANGMQVRSITEPAALADACGTWQPSLLLLDQRLGETTGTDVLKSLRDRSDLPCIVVTGMPDVMDRIVNLEIGADDEVDKALQPREILARIRSVLRRNRPVIRPSAPGRWEFSAQRRELRRPDGSLCHLTSAEFAMFQALHDSMGTPISRARLSEIVFGRAFTVEDRAVDTVVRKLRRKIEPGEEPTIIKTVRPFGYIFTGFPEPAG